MGRKKKSQSKSSDPVVPSSRVPGSPSREEQPSLPERMKKAGLTRFALLGMGWGGAFLGILSGLNQWPEQPAEMSSQAAGAAWMGAILGLQRLDWNTASQTGFLGLVVGLGFALSFMLPERKMLLTWLVATSGMFVGYSLLTNPVGAAGGWVFGWMVSQLTPVPED